MSVRTKTCRLKVSMQHPEWLDELTAFAEILHGSLKIRDRLFRAFQRRSKLFRVEFRTATRTGIIVDLQPTNQLADLLFAIRASELQPLIVKKAAHARKIRRSNAAKQANTRSKQ